MVDKREMLPRRIKQIIPTPLKRSQPETRTIYMAHQTQWTINPICIRTRMSILHRLIRRIARHSCNLSMEKMLIVIASFTKTQLINISLTQCTLIRSHQEKQPNNHMNKIRSFRLKLYFLHFHDATKGRWDTICNNMCKQQFQMKTTSRWVPEIWGMSRVHTWHLSNTTIARILLYFRSNNILDRVVVWTWECQVPSTISSAKGICQVT